MVWKIILIAFGAFLGVTSYLLYQNFVRSITVFLVILNVLVVVAIYVYLHIHYRSVRNSGIRTIIRDIKAIQANKSVPSGPLTQEFEEVHDAVTELSVHIKTKEQMRSEILNMVNSVASNMELEKLLSALMPKLLETSRSNWGAFYLANNATNKLELKSSIGFSKNIYNEFDINIGEGFIGETALSREVKMIRDVPDDTVFVSRTFLGKIKPKNIMLVPIISQEQLMGILTLASLYEYTGEQMEIVEMIKYYIGAAIENSVIYERSKRLTNELQFQNKLIHDLNIELETKIHDEADFTDVFLSKIEAFAVYSLDKDLNISLWNKGAEIVFGYGANEVIGKNIRILYTHKENVEDYIYAKVQVININRRILEKDWKVKKDGSLFYADSTVFGIYNNYGELVGYTAITNDITEFKTTIDRLNSEMDLNKELISRSKVATVHVNQDGMVLFANAAAAELIYSGNSDGIDISSKAFTMNGMQFCTVFEQAKGVEEFMNGCEPNLRQRFTSVYNGNSIEMTAAATGDAAKNTKNILVFMEAVK